MAAKAIRWTLAGVALLGLAGCGPCNKEKPPPPTPIEEVLTEAVGAWTVGQWCEYRLVSAGGKKAEVLAAVTGEESIRGRDYFWLEFTVERDNRKVITKALVPHLERVSFLESGKDLTKDSERLIIKAGDAPAVELPLKELQLLQKALEITGKGVDLNEVFGGGEDVGAEVVGEEDYEILAGKKLHCEKMVLTKAGREAGFALADDEVPIFGIAYSEHEKGTLSLVDFGDSGATTAITEEPQKLDFGGLLKDFKDIKIK